MNNSQNIEIRGGDRLRKCMNKYTDKRGQFNRTIRKFIQNSSTPSLNLEKIHPLSYNLYSIRMRKGWRIILHKESSSWLVIWFGPHYSYDKIKNFLNSSLATDSQINLVQEAFLDIDRDLESTFQKRHYNLNILDKNIKEHGEFNYSWDIELDRCLEHTDGQIKIICDLRKGKPLFVQGDSGTGKTAAAIYRSTYIASMLKTPNVKVVLLTYNEKLCKVLEYYTSYLGREHGNRIQVNTFIDFMKFIAGKLGIDETNYVTEAETKELLKKAIEKTGSDISLLEAYDLLYTIKMGSNEHFDEGKVENNEHFTKKRWCKKIHGDPETAEKVLNSWEKENLIQIPASELWTLYEQYTELLSEKKYGAGGQTRLHRDIFDQTWDIYYQLQKDIQVDPIIFIVDEVQDFRPLELEVIQLLIANINPQVDVNGHQLTLFGDLNQQITMTDFKWGRFENDWHESPVLLDINLRNTYEISEADDVLFDLCNDGDQKRLKKPIARGNKPQMLVIESEDKMIDWFKAFVQSESYPDTLGVIFGSDKLRTRTLELLENEPFTIKAEDSKGLEFEDLIIMGLFAGYSSSYGKGKEIPKPYRDLWHVTLSRGRNNLMLIISSEELKNLENNILPDSAQRFKDCFDIAYSTEQQRKAVVRFIQNCDYDLPGMTRILFDLGKAEVLWDQYKNDPKTETKKKVISEYCRYKYYKKLIDIFIEYAVERGNKESYLDIAIVSLMTGNDVQFTKYMEQCFAGSSSIENKDSIISLINYVESIENYQDYLPVILQYFIDKQVVNFKIFTELLLTAKSSTVKEIVTTCLLKNIIESNKSILNHMELI